MEAVLPDPVPNDLSTLLAEAQRGTPAALDAVFEATYSHLRAVARSLLRRERPDHTLQATDLVHAAWIKLVDQSRVSWTDRAHFLNIGARAMRQILVDHAKAGLRQKRGAGMKALELDEGASLSPEPTREIVDLNDALEQLASLDMRKAQVVELKYFGGLKFQEIAEVLKVSEVTVRRDWTFSRAWLYAELRPAD